MKLHAILLSIFVLAGCAHETAIKEQNEKPNVVIIFADDLGYGDLGVYGHPTIRTPHLDKLATEGQKWTNFYASSSICTPSRTGLLTGRLPIRSGMCSNERGVLFPDSKGGIPEYEILISELLKEQGYKTACVGKWHLGHLPQYLPTSNGFDSYYGIPYSNDMDRIDGAGFNETGPHPEVKYFNVPLMKDEEIIERPANQHTIVSRYTDESIKFIKENKDEPFFLYLAHSLPHVPLFASEKFEGTSKRGLYGDVVEEIDWSVGQIISALKENGLDKNTLVVFTSDNGPWLHFNEAGGSAGLLREGKGTSYEGGMREPGIFWWPEKVKPGVISDVGSTLDLFPTICKITGMDVPTDRIYDGVDISPVLFEEKATQRDEIFYYDNEELFAIRKGKWKIHYATRENAYSKQVKIVKHDPPLLYNLEVDPSEKYNLAADNAEIIEKLSHIKDAHLSSVEPVEDQLVLR
ncbi:MAG: arylsulfatase [Thalassobius sp.]|nr:arylsulfatase [Thalassovita sp.]